MRIQEVVCITGLSRKAINLYEKKGLLHIARDESGYRCHTGACPNADAHKNIAQNGCVTCGYAAAVTGKEAAATGYAKGAAGKKARTM